LKRLLFLGDFVESISGGLAASNHWIKDRSDQIKKMIKAVFRAMVYAKTYRRESVSLVMSRWQLERDIAEKVFDLTVRTWSEDGVVSDSMVLISMQESLAVFPGKRGIPISQVVDFGLARQVAQEIKQK